MDYSALWVIVQSARGVLTEVAVTADASGRRSVRIDGEESETWWRLASGPQRSAMEMIENMGERLRIAAGREGGRSRSRCGLDAGYYF